MVGPNRGAVFWLEMEAEAVPKALLVEPITVLGAQRIDELCRALAASSGC